MKAHNSTLLERWHKTVTTTKDAFGSVVSMQDPGGTVNYTYFANGNLKKSDYNGSIQTIEQDGCGRKTKLTDPSAGVYECEYEYNYVTMAYLSENGVAADDDWEKVTHVAFNGARVLPSGEVDFSRGSLMIYGL